MKQDKNDTKLNIVEIFKLYGQALKYKSGEIILQKGDSTDKLYYIMNGRVRTYCINENGDEITLFYIDENQLIGTESLSSIQKRKVSVDSVTDVTLYLIDANLFMEKCIENKLSILNLMEYFVSKIIMLSNYICCTRFMRNEDKLSYFLYTSCSNGGNIVKYTHEQIASLTGMNRVTVTKLMKNLEDKKLITQNYGEVIVLKKDELIKAFNSIGYLID